MKNSFIVQYAAHLGVVALGIQGGFFGAVGVFIIQSVLGMLLDKGIITADIQIDKLKQGLKEKEWKTAIEKAYANATAKVYTEAEKDAIRQQYLKALESYATFGSKPKLPNDKNT